MPLQVYYAVQQQVNNAVLVQVYYVVQGQVFRAKLQEKQVFYSGGVASSKFTVMRMLVMTDPPTKTRSAKIGRNSLAVS